MGSQATSAMNSAPIAGKIRIASTTQISWGLGYTHWHWRWLLCEFYELYELCYLPSVALMRTVLATQSNQQTKGEKRKNTHLRPIAGGASGAAMEFPLTHCTPCLLWPIIRLTTSQLWCHILSTYNSLTCRSWGSKKLARSTSPSPISVSAQVPLFDSFFHNFSIIACQCHLDIGFICPWKISHIVIFYWSQILGSVIVI